MESKYCSCVVAKYVKYLVVSGVVIRLKCMLALLKNIELNKGSLESAVPLESGFGICFIFYQNNNSLTVSVG